MYDITQALPEEVLLHILELLDAESLCKITAVCYQFYNLSQYDHMWRKLFCAKWKIARQGLEPRMKSWRLRFAYKCKTERNWKNHPPCESKLSGHQDWVSCMAFVQKGDQQLLASSSHDKSIKFWDLDSLSCVQTFNDHEGGVSFFEVHEGTLVSSGWDRTVRIWDMDGNCKSVLRGHTSTVGTVAFDGTSIVSGSRDRTICVWDPNTAQQLRALHGHTGPVLCLSYEPQYNVLLSGADDRTIRVWDFRSGKCEGMLEGHTAAVQCMLQQSIKRVISGSDDNTLRVWDFRTRTTSRVLTGHESWVWALGGEGSLVWSGAHDTTMRLWDLDASGDGADEANPLVRTVKAHDDGVLCVTIGAGGALVCGGSYDRSISILDFSGGRYAGAAEREPCEQASPSGR